MKQFLFKTIQFSYLLLLWSSSCQNNIEITTAYAAHKPSPTSLVNPLGSIATAECRNELTDDTAILILQRTYDSTYIVFANDLFGGILQDTVYAFVTTKYHSGKHGITYSEQNFIDAMYNDTLLGVIMLEFHHMICTSYKYYLFKKTFNENGNGWKKLTLTTLFYDGSCHSGIILRGAHSMLDYSFLTPWSIREKNVVIEEKYGVVSNTKITRHFNPIDGSEIKQE